MARYRIEFAVTVTVDAESEEEAREAAEEMGVSTSWGDVDDVDVLDVYQTTRVP